jgi:uncharacterized repeat protein (TIGR03806 family)
MVSCGKVSCKATGSRVSRRGKRLGRHHAGVWAVAAAAGVVACGSTGDETLLLFPDVGAASRRGEPFLAFPPTAAESRHSPELLSDTLAFTELLSLAPAPGLLPYAVQSPLWSDGAQKQRWLAVPAGAPIGFSASAPWNFPEGTVFVKHFGMALDERAPDDVRRLETRFLVAARGGGFYGLVYRWDDDQRDARLLLEGAEEVLQIVQEDGSLREQPYTYPSQQSCNACHSPSAGYVMGVRTAQLNGDYAYAEPTGDLVAFNQLALWSRLGLFEQGAGSGAPGAGTAAQAGLGAAGLGGVSVDELQRLVPLTDDSAPPEARVRSYWDSNCSSCHNDGSSSAAWDARFSTPLAEQGVILAEPTRGSYPDDMSLVTPGAPERSLIYVRSESAQPGVRMPPMLRNRVDER